MTQRFQQISTFEEEPYSKILCFPKVKESEVKKRLKELKKLGVTHVSFTGPLQIEKCHILGKGYVGMVVLAKKNNEIVALKIRRIDSPRKNMSNEANNTHPKNDFVPESIFSFLGAQSDPYMNPEIKFKMKSQNNKNG